MNTWIDTFMHLTLVIIFFHLQWNNKLTKSETLICGLLFLILMRIGKI
jgi:hypothetical protein